MTVHARGTGLTDRGSNGEERGRRPAPSQAVAWLHPWAIVPKVAQGLVRRRVQRPSDDAAEGGTALVSSTMEPSALTKSSPHVLGAECTAVGLQLLKPKRARAGKEELAIGLIISSAIVAADGIGIGWEGTLPSSNRRRSSRQLL